MAKRRRIAATYSEQMRRIYKQYLAEGGTLPVKLDALYEFATRTGNKLWEPPPPVDPRKIFCKEMSHALREDIFTDDEGRTVRRLHPVFVTDEDESGKKVRKTRWDDIDSAPREHMEGAFQLRRRQIVGDCKQLKSDVDHRNGVHRDEKPHQLLLDFRDDVDEANLPTEYTPDADPDQDDEADEAA